MKKLLLSLILLVFIGHCIHAQLNTDSVIQDIRKKYQLINKKKDTYEKIIETYNWEEEAGIVPEEDELDEDVEYNEMGNYIGDSYEYTTKEGEKRLLVIKDQTSLYQEQSEKKTQREFYYWNDQLFFYYEKRIESSVRNPQDIAKEIRIYLHNDKIIKYLTKEIKGENFLLKNVDFQKVKNQEKNVSTITEEDYLLLKQTYLAPDW